VLLTALGIGITTVLAAASRVTTRALQALVATRTVVATGALLREELGSATVSEVTLAGSGVVRFNRTIGSAPACAGAGNALLLRASEWRGIRAPVPARDMITVLIDVATGSWSGTPIDSVGNAHCPDGSNAIRVVAAGGVGMASYARVEEPVELRGYLSGGLGWWGLAPGDGLSPVQPFAGPLVTPLQSPLLTSSELALPFRASTAAATVVQRYPLGPP
jgi:hypothetical protein